MGQLLGLTGEFRQSFHGFGTSLVSFGIYLVGEQLYNKMNVWWTPKVPHNLD